MQRISASPAYNQPKKIQQFLQGNSFMAWEWRLAFFGLAFMLWQPTDKAGESLERVRPNTVLADSSDLRSGDNIDQITPQLKILSATGQVQVFKENGFVWRVWSAEFPSMCVIKLGR